MVRRRRRGRVQLRAIGAAEHTAAAGTSLRRAARQKLHRVQFYIGRAPHTKARTNTRAQAKLTEKKTKHGTLNDTRKRV